MGELTFPASVRVRMVPDWREGNPYQALLAKGLQQTRCSVDFANYRPGWWALNQVVPRNACIDVLHLHWEHPLLHWALWSNWQFIRKLKRWAIVADVLLLRIRGVKVIWTIHNRVSHETRSPAGELELRRALASAVTRLIVHSTSALQVVRGDLSLHLRQREKFCVIPHGNYEGHYTNAEKGDEHSEVVARCSSSTTTILFFGAIRQYKGLGRLVRAFQSTQRADLRLLVAGKTYDDLLRSQLVELAAQDPRISLELGFVEDNRVIALFERADVVAVPFEKTLTSGSVLLAMTMGKALILPDDARVLDTPGDAGACYFSDDSDLIVSLSNLDKTRLAEMGAANRVAAAARDWTTIGVKTRRAYGC